MTACGEGNFDTGLSDEEVEAVDGTLEQPSYILTTSAWTSTTIPVCWETAGSATEKAWVRNIVESRYEGRSQFYLNFTGWGQCNSGSTGIRIRVHDSGPHTLGLGRYLNGVHNGMSLNFTFHNWGTSCASPTSTRRQCIESIAVHEFGHALGLAHEQNRADRPSSCTDSPQGTNGDLYVGNWDIHSMMNYCNPSWNNAGVPSAGDIAGLARLYGGRGDVFVARSSGSSFGIPAKLHNWFCVYNETCKLADVNGDGRDDLVTFTRGTTGDVWVSLSTGGGWFGASSKWHDSFCYGNEICEVGDVTGDGRADILAFTRGTTGDVYVAVSNGSHFNYTGWKWHDNFCFNSEIPQVGDFNGDGRDDIATFTRGNTGDVYVALSNGWGTFSGQGWKWHDWFSINNEIPKVGDVNGDGRDDIITFTRGNTGDVWVALSTGSNSFGPGLKWHNWFCINSEICDVADINGDGRDDIVTYLRGNTGIIYGALSNGSNKFGGSWKWASGQCLRTDECRTGDITGDGRADAVAFTR